MSATTELPTQDHLLLAQQAGPLTLVSPPALELRSDLNDFRVALFDAVARATRVVVDLSPLTRLDVAGAGVLAGAARRAHQHGGTLRLTGASVAVRQTLARTGLARHLDLG